MSLTDVVAKSVLVAAFAIPALNIPTALASDQAASAVPSQVNKRRTPIGLEDSTRAMVLALSEGNFGASRVLTDILKSSPVDARVIFLGLDDMNMRGPQIWVAYKDFAGQDLEKLKEAVHTRDRAMVDRVNEVMLKDPSYPYTVVESCASCE